jgi:Flp pilus assembly protein TadG
MGRHHSRTGALSDEHGQAVVFVMVFLVVVIALVGFVIDVGHAYQAQRSLQGAADAAALAGAQELPDPAAAQQLAQQYGSSAAGKNKISDVAVTEQVTTSCNATIPGCAPVNMVSVDEKATVPTYFAKIIGVNSFSLNVHAAACSPCGSKPVDIVLVLDRTGSMCQDGNGNDQHPTCPDMNNAKNGLRTFLQYFDPNLAHVGFVVLPPATDSSHPCGTPGSYNTSSAYELVPLSSDFRKADGTLNESSSLVSTITCVKSDGSTAYANAIDAAQAELVQHGRANVPKMIVFASDGAANTGPTTYSSTSPYRTQPCHQGITSANAAKATGTVIYSIGYAMDDATGGCMNSVPNQLGRIVAESPAITVREALQGIASTPDKFLERPDAGQLQTIYAAIAQDISHGSSSLIN